MHYSRSHLSLSTPRRCLQDDLAELEAREAAERAGSSGATNGARTHGEAVVHAPETDANVAADGDEEEPVDGADVPDPLAGMTAQQRKLYELKQKLRVGQKANQHAIIAERKREKVHLPH